MEKHWVGIDGALYRIWLEERDWGAPRIVFDRVERGWIGRAMVAPGTCLDRLSATELRRLLDEARLEG